MRKVWFNLTFVFAAFAPVLVHATTYNAVTGFSSASNANGVWSYGDGTPGGTLNLYSTSGANYAGISGAAYWATGIDAQPPYVIDDVNGTPFFTVSAPSDVLWMHPGDTDAEASVVEFTAPVSGTYNLAGLFERIDTGGGNGVNVSIYKDSSLLVGPTLLGTTYLDSSSFSQTVSLNAGDTLNFDVARNGYYGNDSTGLKLTITDNVSAVPEPSSLLLLSTGILGLASAARRRFKA